MLGVGLYRLEFDQFFYVEDRLYHVHGSSLQHIVWKVLIPSQVTVYAGSNIRWSGSQNRSASRVVVHPNYEPSTFSNDIALIKLSSPLDMTDSGIHIICLPSINSTVLANGEWPVANTTVSYSLLYSK